MIKKYLLYALTAVVVIIALNQIGSRTSKKLDVSFDQTKEAIIKKANEDTTDRTSTEKITDAATSLIQDTLSEDSNKTEAYKDNFAAGTFSGQHYRQTVMVPKVCAEKGTDLAPFKTAYINAHQSLYVIAAKILKKSGQTIGTFNQKQQQFMRNLVEKEIQDIKTLLMQSSKQQLTDVDACEFYNLIAKNSLNDILFKTNFPDAYKRIIAYQ